MVPWRPSGGRAGQLVPMTRDRFQIHRLHIPLSMDIDSVNSYFCAEPVPTLIDVPPNHESAHLHLEAALAAIGFSAGDIGRILITHPHLDHFGSARWVRERSGAEVWVVGDGARRLENAGEEIEKDYRYYCRFLDWAGTPRPGEEYLRGFFERASGLGPGVPVQRHLDWGEKIEIGKAFFTVMPVPGHTPWCTLYYDEETSTGFTGDFLIRDIKSNAVVRRPEADRDGYRSLAVYIRSLDRTRAMGLKKAFPGHGEPIEDAGERIGQVLALIERRQEEILAVVRKDSLTPYGIVERIFSGLPRFHILLGISEVVGHLEVLEERGRVKREKGTALYRATDP